MVEHTRFTYRDLHLMPTFERMYHYYSLIEKFDARQMRENGWDT
jgi:hypothetical protein